MQKRFLVVIIIIIFILFLFFFSLLKVYEINITLTLNVRVKVYSFQNKIFINDDIQKSYFKIKLRKRNKSPTYTFLQVNLNLKNRQTRRIRCLRAYYLGDSFYLECLTDIRLANSRWYWKSDGQASYSRLIPLIFISAHVTGQLVLWFDNYKSLPADHPETVNNTRTDTYITEKYESPIRSVCSVT